MAEIASQVDGFAALELACAVFLVEEVCNKVVANHRQEVRVTHCTVLSLRNIDLFIKIFLLLVVFLN
jgi:hypothetical protein